MSPSVSEIWHHIGPHVPRYLRYDSTYLRGCLET
jgi:hypothetical protein